MKKHYALILLTLALSISGYQSKAQWVFSQRNMAKQYSSVGLSAGSAHYFGDLARPRYFQYSLYTHVRPSVSAHYTRHFNENFAVRMQGSWVRLYGNDYTMSQRNIDVLWQQAVRNLHFRNDVKELAFSAIINPLPQYVSSKGAQGRAKVRPFISVGVGGIFHNPKARSNPFGYDPTTKSRVPNTSYVPDKWVSLRQYHTSGQEINGSPIKQYSLVQAVVPLGFGINYKLNDNWDFGVEGNFRFSSTDYIDDVGPGRYPDLDYLKSNFGELAPMFSYRVIESQAYNGKTLENRIPLITQVINNHILSPTDPQLSSYPPEELLKYYDPSNPLTQFGVSGRKDWYFTAQVRLTYYIPYKVKCPVIK